MYKKLLNDSLKSLAAHHRLYLLNDLKITSHTNITNIFERNGILCIIIFMAGAKLNLLQTQEEFVAKKTELNHKLAQLKERLKDSSKTQEEIEKILVNVRNKYDRQLSPFSLAQSSAVEINNFFEKAISDIIEISRSEEANQETLKLVETQDFIFLLGDILNKENAPAENNDLSKQKYNLFINTYNKGLAYFDKKIAEYKKTIAPDYKYNDRKYSIDSLLENISFNLQDISVFENNLIHTIELAGHDKYSKILFEQGITKESTAKIQGFLDKTSIIYKDDEDLLVEKFRQKLLFTRLEKEIQTRAIFDKGEWEKKVFPASEIIRSVYGSFFDVFSDTLAENKIIPKSEKNNVINRVAGDQRFTKEDKNTLLVMLYDKKIFSNEDLEILETTFKKHIHELAKKNAYKIIDQYFQKKLDDNNKLVLAAAMANKQYKDKTILELLNKKDITPNEIDQLAIKINNFKAENMISYQQEIINHIFGKKSTNDAIEALKTMLMYVYNKYYPLFIEYINFRNNKNFKDFIQLVRNALFEKNEKDMQVVYDLFYSIFEKEFALIANKSDSKNHFAENFSIRYLTNPLPEKKWGVPPKTSEKKISAASII